MSNHPQSSHRPANTSPRQVVYQESPRGTDHGKSLDRLAAVLSTALARYLSKKYQGSLQAVDYPFNLLLTTDDQSAASNEAMQ